MGAINCSWTIHRLEIIQLQAEVTELASKVYLDEVNREHKLSSIRKNITRVNEAHDATCAFYRILRESDASEVKAMEEDLTKKVHDLNSRSATRTVTWFLFWNDVMRTVRKRGRIW